jgi:hypothetical protein
VRYRDTMIRVDMSLKAVLKKKVEEVERSIQNGMSK